MLAEHVSRCGLMGADGLFMPVQSPEGPCDAKGHSHRTLSLVGLSQKKDLCEGNHDARVEHFVSKNPLNGGKSKTAGRFG